MGGSSSRTSKIESGDTLWGLGQRYGFTNQQMIDANPGVKPGNLQIGRGVNTLS